MNTHGTHTHTQLAVVVSAYWGAVKRVGLSVTRQWPVLQAGRQGRVLIRRDVPSVDKPCSLSGRKTLPRTQDEGGEEDLLYKRQFY